MTFYIGVFCVDCKYNLVARLETETQVYANSFTQLYLSPRQGTAQKIFFLKKEIDNDDEIEIRSVGHMRDQGNMEFKMLVAKGNYTNIKNIILIYIYSIIHIKLTFYINLIR